MVTSTLGAGLAGVRPARGAPGRGWRASALAPKRERESAPWPALGVAEFWGCPTLRPSRAAVPPLQTPRPPPLGHHLRCGRRTWRRWSGRRTPSGRTRGESGGRKTGGGGEGEGGSGGQPQVFFFSPRRAAIPAAPSLRAHGRRAPPTPRPAPEAWLLGTTHHGGHVGGNVGGGCGKGRGGKGKGKTSVWGRVGAEREREQRGESVSRLPTLSSPSNQIHPRQVGRPAAAVGGVCVARKPLLASQAGAGSAAAPSPSVPCEARLWGSP